MHICLDTGGRFSFHANSIVSEPILEIEKCNKFLLTLEDKIKAQKDVSWS